ncbi:MAG TPA: NADP-binding protein [Acholeplasmataceae bacterium]|jgi:4-hydroxy-tetrahydrodipicolinate reductase|nr:NADP-binding protein [Acholeplasmataceae bacterium]
MRKEKVKVVIWGFGAMGSGMARMILKKQGFEIVGVCDNNPHLAGKSIYQVLNLEVPAAGDLLIQSDIREVIRERCADVVLLATDSYTKKSYPKIKFLLENKINVISTAEEMAYPKANEADLAKELDRISKENGVSVLGTGVNPGMMMDLLVVCLSGIMEEVESIEVARINSLSPFGETVMEEQGVGLSVDEFEAKMQAGKLAGHIGFKESIAMIDKALGLGIDRFKQQMLPIVTSVERKSKYGFAGKGNVAGVDMQAQAYRGDKKIITMKHPQQIEPQLEGTQTGDYITLKGKPEVKMQITPEVDGGIGTIAICVNMIPHIINATPGLKTMIDLPVPRAIVGDVRAMIEVEK